MIGRENREDTCSVVQICILRFCREVAVDGERIGRWNAYRGQD